VRFCSPRVYHNSFLLPQTQTSSLLPQQNSFPQRTQCSILAGTLLRLPLIKKRKKKKRTKRTPDPNASDTLLLFLQSKNGEYRHKGKNKEARELAKYDDKEKDD
jgi:hypothetical protein